MKVKCPFRLRSASSGSSWKIMVRYGFQNHKLFKDLDGHDILDHLKVHERQFVNDMTKYNMTLQYIASALKDKDPENLTSVTQVYKSRATYNTSKQDSLTEMQMLLTLIHKEKYMCWTRNRKDSNVIVDIFYTHPDLVKLLNMFHLVLIFYYTYKINRYRLPMLEIVGVMSTKLIFSIGFAYLEHEREENFKWTLENLKELFFSGTTHGLPCACQLKLYIEEHDVHPEDSGTKLNLEVECEELKTYFNYLDIVGQRVLKKKAIVALLGWSEESWSLVWTQLDTQGREKWMKISDMGYFIACRYNVVFVSLSKRLNITVFPLTLTSPMYTSRHKIIDVGFVNDNHWVQVKLKPDSPLLPVTDLWRHTCTEDAKAWESTYVGHIRHSEDEVRKSS
ncbi:uncharacterized protein LOC127129523 [Lathyrus oleraceus]|uniref:uncharacterized protein LOC127129523 n=1 Tax=Pisum sativum TaxID=3888 RepID=UPI0021D0E10B|nr:uncharacterized protein LOC127129523 [Pisum sativum]